MPKKINQPKVSIIIVNYNGEKFLKGLLNSLKKTKYSNYEIIFVDNASIDNSIKIVEKNYPKVKIIKNINNGFAGGLNIGIKACSHDSEYIIPLNYDMYVHPDWLSYLMETMHSDKKIAVVGYARLLPKSDKIETLGNKCTDENLAKFIKIGAGKNLKEFLSQLKKQDEFCFDTETTGLNAISAKLVGISFCWTEGEAYYLPIDLAEKIKPELSKVFDSNETKKIGHNLKYDIEVMNNHGVEVADPLFDTMVAAYLLDPISGKLGLKVLAKQFLGREMIELTELIGKEAGSFNEVPIDLATDYAASDFRTIRDLSARS